ncbi:hypothetical protein [Alteromonas gilva]|uniref:DUF3850 domain-containing protein n=1 Tax=Alteromonas gilva TaxID=2987522 RepID=A0ABT5L8I6_9ALTE|nr:hypothetical protein [Alteromonas gilva]MDC8832809.1 hypothetical protein [Alteromonas gilva]
MYDAFLIEFKQRPLMSLFVRENDAIVEKQVEVGSKEMLEIDFSSVVHTRQFSQWHDCTGKPMFEGDVIKFAVRRFSDANPYDYKLYELVYGYFDNGQDWGDAVRVCGWILKPIDGEFANTLMCMNMPTHIKSAERFTFKPEDDLEVIGNTITGYDDERPSKIKCGAIDTSLATAFNNAKAQVAS